MADIDFLKELQECDLEIYRLTDKLEAIEENLNLEKIKSEYKVLKERHAELDLELNKVKEELIHLNRNLKENYFNLDDINSKLYDGSVIDIKQLDLLNDEELELKRTTDNLESDTLIAMEKQEILSSESRKLEERQERLKIQLEEIRESNLEKTQEYNLHLKELEKRRNEIILKISPEGQTQYKNIRNRKKDFMAELTEDRCTGCNMILPIYIIDKVKAGELIRCENCNRILYRDK